MSRRLGAGFAAFFLLFLGTVVVPGTAYADVCDGGPVGQVGCGGEDDSGGDGNGGDNGDGNGDGGNERVPFDTHQTPACSINGPPPDDPGVMCMGATATCRQNPDGGTMMRIYYQWEQGGDWELVDTRCSGGEEEPQPPTQEQVREYVTRLLPRGSVSTSPPDGRTLIGMPTIFYTETAPTWGDTVNILGTDVTLEAKAVKYIWNAGDTTFNSTSPGVPYAAGRSGSEYVTHEYTQKGTYDNLSVQIVWDVTYSFGDGAQQSIGPVTAPAAGNSQITVVEGKSRITN